MPKFVRFTQAYAPGIDVWVNVENVTHVQGSTSEDSEVHTTFIGTTGEGVFVTGKALQIMDKLNQAIREARD